MVKHFSVSPRGTEVPRHGRLDLVMIGLCLAFLANCDGSALDQGGTPTGAPPDPSTSDQPDSLRSSTIQRRRAQTWRGVVQDGADDCTLAFSRNWSRTGAGNYYVGYYNSSYPDLATAMVFRGADVPPGAEITSAQLRLHIVGGDGDPVQSRIYGLAEDDPEDFVSGGVPRNRPAGDVEVAWEIGGTHGTWQTSPDLTAIIQAQIDRPGWQAGQAIALVVGRDPTETADEVRPASAERGAATAPELVIDWQLPSSLKWGHEDLAIGPVFSGSQAEVSTAAIARGPQHDVRVVTDGGDGAGFILPESTLLGDLDDGEQVDLGFFCAPPLSTTGATYRAQFLLTSDEHPEGVSLSVDCQVVQPAVAWLDAPLDLGEILVGTLASASRDATAVGHHATVIVDEVRDDCNCVRSDFNAAEMLAHGQVRPTEFIVEPPQTGLEPGVRYIAEYHVHSELDPIGSLMRVEFSPTLPPSYVTWSIPQLDLGEVHTAGLGTGQVTAVATSDQHQVQVTAHGGSGQSFINASPMSLGNIEDGGTTQVTFSCQPPLGQAPGEYDAQFALTSLDDTSADLITVRCRVLNSDLSWPGGDVDLGEIVSGASGQTQATLQAKGEHVGIELTELSDDCDCFESPSGGPFDLGDGETAQISLSALADPSLEDATIYRARYLARSPRDPEGSVLEVSFLHTVPVQGGTVEIQVANGSDDVSEDPGASWSRIGPGNQYVGRYNASYDQMGFATRFQNVEIPAGAAIESASLELYIRNTSDAGQVQARVRALAEDDAGPFSASLPSDRAKTDEEVAWQLDGTAPGWQSSPDLTRLVQAVVDRSGWQEGQALALLVDNDGTTTNIEVRPESFDNAPSQAARLRVEWTADPVLRLADGDLELGAVSAGQNVRGTTQLQAVLAHQNVVVHALGGNGADLITAVEPNLGALEPGGTVDLAFDCSPAADQALGDYQAEFNIRSQEDPQGVTLKVHCTVADSRIVQRHFRFRRDDGGELTSAPTCSSDPPDLGGMRSSVYGAVPFPDPEGWGRAMKNMQARYPGSDATAIWIVGYLEPDTGECVLEFPADGQSADDVIFEATDKHEAYLDYFDEIGAKVYLQVEPGLANIDELIDIVLDRYGHHPSVVGFGVDWEWFGAANNQDINDHTAVTNSQAQAWETRVKHHNPEYQLFLKHWLQNLMPSSYRGDLIFIDDSQQLSGLSAMVNEFDAWADRFAPNDVMFQVGYESDYGWWRGLDDPMQEIGCALSQQIDNAGQKVGIAWVDFTMHEADFPEVDLVTSTRFAASWLAAEDSPIDGLVRGQRLRLRYSFANDGPHDVLQARYGLRQALLAPGQTCDALDDSAFVTIPPASSSACTGQPLCLAVSPHRADGATTHELLSNSAGSEFVPGQLVADPSQSSGLLDIAAGEHSELEFVLKVTDAAHDAARYCIRPQSSAATIELGSASQAAVLAMSAGAVPQLRWATGGNTSLGSTRQGQTSTGELHIEANAEHSGVQLTALGGSGAEFISAGSLGDDRLADGERRPLTFSCQPSEAQAPGQYSARFAVHSTEDPSGDEIEIECTVLGQASRIRYAGARSSYYGATPWPNDSDWQKIMVNMASYFEGAQPAAIWIVGHIHNDDCVLEFPSDGSNYADIVFDDYGRHHRILDRFDAMGIKVFLQVESGDADIDTLIDITMDEFSGHPSVIGFGVDVEWFHSSENPGWGRKVTDAEAQQWEQTLKAHDPGFQLFLKHWDAGWMPPNYRGDILFVNDSQMFPDMAAMVDEFAVWASIFEPNPVMYQYGYDYELPDLGLTSDYEWWGHGQLDNPPLDIGRAIAERVWANNPDQELSMAWVDFTLRYPEIDLFSQPPAFPFGIELNSTAVPEHSPGAEVGEILVSNYDSSAVHTYDLSDDRFEITGGRLRLRPGVSVDRTDSSEIMLEITASHGGRSYREDFAIEVLSSR